jgi:DNA-binding PadR family transcriptional regulator
MKVAVISELGHAILGLLQYQAYSGYGLRKVFSSTSMKTYSDSPGAIYSALRRLEQQGLIRGTVEGGAGLRQRQTFQLTPKGQAELKKWIASPVTREDLLWGQQEILLRFAFSEQTVGRTGTLQLLKSLETALEAYVAALHAEFKAMPPSTPDSGRLAFQCGLKGNESFLEWTRYAIAIYEKEGKKKGGTS